MAVGVSGGEAGSSTISCGWKSTRVRSSPPPSAYGVISQPTGRTEPSGSAKYSPAPWAGLPAWNA
ncbi:hypothetical protein ACFXDP_33300 [Streptomyces sp. NPDC059374]|uniref:hypothetical protein n=1 Tax=Streptomyces sp. NPDC059374 TaxID=3346814 RepID=UPI0036C1FC2A